MSNKLQINEQFKTLLPPLSDEEFTKLEELILEEGCTESIKVWTDKSTDTDTETTYIVDGHNRYNICTKHNLEFQTFVLGYDTKDEVISWMVDTQLGRRNLTPIQKVGIAEKYRPVYEKQNKEKKLGSLKQNSSVVPKSSERAESVNTRDALAKIAGIGHDTYNKGKKILDLEKEKGTNLTTEEKDTIEKVKSGEVKINTGHDKLFGKSKPKSKTKTTEPTINPEPKPSEAKETKPKVSEPKVVETVETVKVVEVEIDDSQKLSSEQEVLSLEPKVEKIDTSTEKSQYQPTEAEAIKDMKTEKIAIDHLIVSDELFSIKRSIQEQIRIAQDKIFNRYHLPDMMTAEDRSNFVAYMDEIIGNLVDLKNKI